MPRRSHHSVPAKQEINDLLGEREFKEMYPDRSGLYNSRTIVGPRHVDPAAMHSDAVLRNICSLIDHVSAAALSIAAFC